MKFDVQIIVPFEEVEADDIEEARDKVKARMKKVGAGHLLELEGEKIDIVIKPVLVH